MCMRDIYDIYIPFIHLMFIYIFKWVGNFLRIESTYQCMEVALSGSEIRGFQLKILRKMNFLRQFWILHTHNVLSQQKKVGLIDGKFCANPIFALSTRTANATKPLHYKELTQEWRVSRTKCSVIGPTRKKKVFWVMRVTTAQMIYAF